MRLLWLMPVALSLSGQDGPPVRILQGELIEWQVQAGAGSFSIREADNQVHWCRLEPETYITRQSHRVSAVGVRPRDQLEVIADLRKGGCVAVTIYVRPPETARRYPRLMLPPPPRTNFMDNLYQRGNMTFAGVVQRLDQEMLVLKTRAGSQLLFQLRPDTVFSAWGKEVDSKSLAPQTIVYVRAGNVFGGDMEAFQIVWGDILTPR